MTSQQIQDSIDRLVDALNETSQGEPSKLETLASLGPLAILVAALLAFGIGLWNLHQKSEADARSEWWRRTQWALEATTTNNPRLFDYGAGTLERLADTKLAHKEDKALLDAVWQGEGTKMQDERIEALLADAEAQDLDVYAQDSDVTGNVAEPKKRWRSRRRTKNPDSAGS